MGSPDLRGPILLSIAAAVITIALKFVAYALTGSVGFFSDALESVVNLIAALTAAMSLWYAARPPDPSHTFGHEKIEYFSSGLEGLLIVFAGLGTVWYAVDRLIHPKPLESLGVGLVISVVATGVNFFAAIVLLRVGKKYGSIILEADGHHLMSDVWTTVGVVGGLTLVWLTGFVPLDATVAIFVSLNILRTGYRLIRRSFDGLMDHALPAEEQARIRALFRAALPPGTDFHAVRTRQAGRRKFAELHLLVPGQMSVHTAHELTHTVESQVKSEMPELVITIHLEPIEDRASWEAAELIRLGEPAGPEEGTS
ncbi:MAG TPA: cation diffusion facilitator family transporter [Fimbriiglobus sp.]|jgi:cation diffusion facilitator family transporter